MGFYATAIAFARSQCGAVTECEITDATILGVLLPIAAHEFSSLIPRRGYHQLTLVDGTALYDLPDPLIMSVLEWSDASGYNTDSPLGGGYGGACGTNDAYLTGVGPFLADYARNRLDNSIVSDVQVIGGRLEVIPTPDSSDVLHIRTNDAWELDTEELVDDIPQALRLTYLYTLSAMMAEHISQEAAMLEKISIGGNTVVVNWKALASLSVALRERARLYAPKQHAAITQG